MIEILCNKKDKKDFVAELTKIGFRRDKCFSNVFNLRRKNRKFDQTVMLKRISEAEYFCSKCGHIHMAKSDLGKEHYKFKKERKAA